MAKKKSAPDNDFFYAQIQHIKETYPNEIEAVNHSMGVALMGIGMRNRELHAKALNLANQIGLLAIETDTGQKKTFSVEEKLSHKVVLQKLGL